VDLLETHSAEVRHCSLCFPRGGNAPVVADPVPRRVLLVGQAPGIREIVTRKPFTGPAGKRLDTWLREAGISQEEIYLSAICRCFPGKAKGGGDRLPSRAMISNCRSFLDRELELLRPEVVIPVGGLAIRELLGIEKLTAAIGERYERDGVIYVPLPHPSGASTWFHKPENKRRLARALALVGRFVRERNGSR
jgi:uracil-DNA glycosylase